MQREDETVLFGAFTVAPSKYMMNGNFITSAYVTMFEIIRKYAE
jgi:hypothetical protein